MKRRIDRTIINEMLNSGNEKTISNAESYP